MLLDTPPINFFYEAQLYFFFFFNFCKNLSSQNTDGLMFKTCKGNMI